MFNLKNKVVPVLDFLCATPPIEIVIASVSEAIRSGAHPSPTLPVQGERTITKKYSYGFTLAETLITLVIIGIVAALTVPVMITKFQKEQTVARLKKAYSALSQTTAKAIADYGAVRTWDIGENGDVEAAKTFVNKYIVPYMRVMKKPTSYAEGHWNNKIYFLNGTEVDPDSDDGTNKQVRFYLDDGTSISCYIRSDDYTRLTVLIDINGDKKPNYFGKDIFMYQYLIRMPDYWEDYLKSQLSKFYPEGYPADRNTLKNQGWACNKLREGAYCAALIMYDGWQIKDDYPW